MEKKKHILVESQTERETLPLLDSSLKRQRRKHTEIVGFYSPTAYYQMQDGEADISQDVR